MTSLDNDLEALSGELECLDYLVVKHGDYICRPVLRSPADAR